MDVGIDRKSVKGKPGVHVHFYTSQSPGVLTFDSDALPDCLTAESLCIQVFKHDQFVFTEKEFPLMDRDPGKIYPPSMHLFQLWDCEQQQWLVSIIFQWKNISLGSHKNWLLQVS